MHRYVASVGACVPEHGSTQRCFKLDMDDVTLLTLRHHSMRIDPIRLYSKYYYSNYSEAGLVYPQ